MSNINGLYLIMDKGYYQQFNKVLLYVIMTDSNGLTMCYYM